MACAEHEPDGKIDCTECLLASATTREQMAHWLITQAAAVEALREYARALDAERDKLWQQRRKLRRKVRRLQDNVARLDECATALQADNKDLRARIEKFSDALDPFGTCGCNLHREKPWRGCAACFDMIFQKSEVLSAPLLMRTDVGKFAGVLEEIALEVRESVRAHEHGIAGVPVMLGESANASHAFQLAAQYLRFIVAQNRNHLPDATGLTTHCFSCHSARDGVPWTCRHTTGCPEC
jgi:hypothetical protein